MRLWHKALIPVLPKQQLLGQWRECCCIARNISVDGTPNHILVNKIMTYNIQHFITYSYLIADEMYRRGYRVDKNRFDKYFHLQNIIKVDLFKGWHDMRYLTQCYFNLQEKYDCGGISEEEWNKIDRTYRQIANNYCCCSNCVNGEDD